MGRRVVGFSAIVLMTLLAGCGGGTGSGSSGGSVQPNRLTLTVGSVQITQLQTTTFTATLVDTNGAPMAGFAIQFSVVPSGGLQVSVDGDSVTNASGQVNGTVQGILAGTWGFQAVAPDVAGASATKNIQVRANPDVPSPTFTPGGAPTPTGTPKSTSIVSTIFMETDKFAISAANGDTVTVTAIAFDQNNIPVNNVQLLFDFSPKIGTLMPISTLTGVMNGQAGEAQVQIKVPPNTAPPGVVTVTASAAGVTGTVTFTVVSGTAPKPVATVLLQSDVSACGQDVGGSVTLNATVFDADNNPINGVNVLFITSVGQVIPLTSMTDVVGSQGGRARTTLQIPAGAVVLRDAQNNIIPYELDALAGGVEGKSQIFIVPGRQSCTATAGGDPGAPASVVLGASPTRIRVRGAGKNELTNVTATVFDNNGNRLDLAQVRFSIPSTSVAAGAVLLPASNDPFGSCTGDPEQTCTSDANCPSGDVCLLTPNDRFTVFSDRAGNASIQVRSGTGLGTVTVQVEVPTTIQGSNLTVPCTDPSVPGEQCITSGAPLVTVTSGLASRVSLSINAAAIDNNDGTLLTTMSAIVSDAQGNIVDDGTPVFFEVVPFNDADQTSRQVALQGFSVTNGSPPCDVTQFVVQTGIVVTPQPGDAITCVKYPLDSAGTLVQMRVEGGNSDVVSTQTVTLPGVVANLITALPPSVRVTATTPGVALITVVAIDDSGNRVPNVNVQFETDTGSFSSIRPPGFLFDQRTDSDGLATATLTVPAGTPSGNIDIRVWGGGNSRPTLPTGQIEIMTTGGTGPAGQPSSISFVGATPDTIGVAGSGLPEQSVLSFKVVDSQQTPLSDVTVNFFLNGIGGETLTPATSQTDDNGIATVTVISGTRAAPVQVTASVDVTGDGSADLVTQSTALNVVGAPPTFSRFSLAAEFLNVAGQVTFGLKDTLTAFLNDRFGNAPPPSTVVSFLSNGVSVVGQTTTDESGQATTTLLSENSVPPGGVVTILAMTRGEEPFTDQNGNGRYDVGEPFVSIPEPFIDANGNGQYDPPEPFTDTNGNGHYDEGEPFTDTNGNGRYDANELELFVDINDNHVWDAEQNPGTWESNAMIWTTTEVTMSAHTFVSVDPTTFQIEGGGSATFSLFVGDAFGNSIVGGSSVEVKLSGTGAGDATVTPESFDIPDTETFGFPVPGINTFNVRIDSKSPMNAESLGVTFDVTSPESSDAPGGNGSVQLTIFGTLLPPPPPATGTPGPPTPTPTVTPTPLDTPTPTITPTASPSPAPRSLVFVSAQPSTIGVRGSGLPEQSTLTFKVTDALANPLGGILVEFSLVSVGGESIAPLQAVSTSDGLVSTVLSSGESAVSVRVTARTAVDSSVFAQSTQVAIVGAPPVADRFSLAPQFLNISGRTQLGIQDTITAFLNDRFGNGVPAGTAVSFTTNGGSIVNATATDARGQATAVLVSEGGSLPPNGVVDILATTRGEEPFVDTNGNGSWDPGEPFTDIPEPFIDRNGNGVYDPDDPFERFIDTNGNGVWDASQSNGTWSGDAVIWATTSVTFSGHTTVDLQPSSFFIPEGGSRTFTLTISDDLDNPIIGGSQVQISLSGSTQGLLAGIPSTFTLPDTETFGQIVDGVNRFTFQVIDNQPGQGTDEPIVVNVNVTSSGLPAGGNGTRSASATGVIGGVPTPLPTSTPTIPGPTPTMGPPTATGTMVPPATSTPAPPATDTPVPTVTPTIGQPASIQFVSAVPQTVGVRASGLPEQSVLTFRVTDAIGNAIINAPVSFTLTGIGNETITPDSGFTGLDGQVSTTLTSGTRATTVRVTATTAGLFAQSTAVSVLGAPPSMNRFSLAADKVNVAGRVSFGIEDKISAFVNDRFGNAVPSGTSLSFLTNGASIVTPTTTAVNGVATATLLTEGEIPPTGIVTVMAFTRGEEGFLDNNGNGVFDPGEEIVTDNVPEPFIDFRPPPAILIPPLSPPSDASCPIGAPSNLCNDAFDPSVHFEVFVDTQPLNGVWNPQGTSGVWDDNILVFDTIPITFSGKLQTPIANPTSFSIPDGGAQAFTITVHDDLRNPLVGGSLISVTSTEGQVVGGNITVPDGESFNQIVDGLTRFSFVIQDSQPGDTDPPKPATVTVSITSDNGSGVFVVAGGTVD